MILLLLFFRLFQQKLADAYNQKNRKNIAIIKWKNSLFFVAKASFWGEERNSKARVHYAGKQEFYCLSDALTGA